MEEMQEALRGKSRQSEAIDCMLSEAECSFSTDSLDRAIREESSQRDSSTMISEFSSTRTLMNIDDEGKRCFEEEDPHQKGFFLSRRFSDSLEIEQEITTTEYSWEMSASNKETSSFECVENALFENTKRESKNGEQRGKMDKKTRTERVSKVVRKKKLESMEEKTVTKKCTETKSHPVKNRRDSASGTSSKYSNVHKMRLSRPLTVEKSIKGTNVNVKARSLSPDQVKYSKMTESSEKHRNVKSPSPTRSRQVRSNDKLIATKCAKFKEEEASIINDEAACRRMESMNKMSIESENRSERRKKIVLDFNEFPPPKSERKNQARSDLSNIQEAGFYLSPIEENSEASTGSGQSKQVIEHYGKMMETSMEYDHVRKYHTYPKSRIPVARWSKERRFGNLMMDPKMYPLEPREIDLEAFQQLHTADSQEELQEFLLLESQCSGNLGLAGNMSTSEVSCNEHHSEDERGTMSGIIVDRIINNLISIFFSVFSSRDCFFFSHDESFCVRVFLFFFLTRLLTSESRESHNHQSKDQVNYSWEIFDCVLYILFSSSSTCSF